MNENFISGLNSPYGVAVIDGHIYWDSRFGNAIGRADLNGTHVNNDFVTGAAGPWDIAAGGDYL